MLLQKIKKMQTAFIRYVFSSEEKMGKRLVLFPLTLGSFLFKGGVSLRNQAYKKGVFSSRKLSIPVVSIGNLTVGGTGKTPATIYCARLLQTMGKRVAVLSRGYKGRAREKVNVVSDGEKIRLGPHEAGDEPYLIAQNLRGVPVLTAKDRGVAGEYARENFLAEVVILDDGFQHARVQKDLDVLLLDGKKPFGNGYLLPRGGLRESPASLKKAHLVMVTNAPEDKRKIKETICAYHADIPIFFSKYLPVSLEHLSSEETLPVDYLQGREAIALAGVGRPEFFSAMLSRMGAQVKETRFFPDHYGYRPQDFTGLPKDSVLVTTEKDAVKLRSFPVPHENIIVVKIELKIEGEEIFHALVKKYLPSLF